MAVGHSVTGGDTVDLGTLNAALDTLATKINDVKNNVLEALGLMAL